MKISEIIKNERNEFVKSLLVSVFMIIIFVFGAVSAFLILNQQNNEKLNDFFYLNYQNFIQKEGASNIRQIVQEVNHISSPDEKLNTIARLIANNFTELYWSESSEYFYKDECSAGLPFNHRFLNNNCNGYGYDKRGALRAKTGNLSNNPFWIAYYKTGACGELAVLFANVTNQSGFVSRVVYSNYPNHAWTEIYLDGEWFYFDPDMYHGLNGDIQYQKEWFNNNTRSF